MVVMDDRLRRLCAPVLLCLVLLLAGCGDDEEPPLRHGLKTAAFESKPVGEAIEVGFDVPDGAAYTCTVSLHTDFWQRKTQGGKPDTKTATASAVLEIIQTFRVPGGDREPSSRIRLRYTGAEGHDATAYLEREPLTGTLKHERSGRAITRSLRLEGGTQAQQVETGNRLAGLYMAGFGSSPGWLPAKAVRVGEAWSVEGFIRPLGMDNALRQARQVGVEAPKPTLTGTIRVVGVQESPEGRVLELEIDALIEIAGNYRKGRDKGRMAIANHVRGKAFLSVRTGLPISFEGTEEIRTDVREGGAETQVRAITRISGTVTRQD